MPSKAETWKNLGFDETDNKVLNSKWHFRKTFTHDESTVTEEMKLKIVDDNLTYGNCSLVQ